MDETAKYFSGVALYGDDMNPAEVAAWYRDEAQAYYQMTLSSYGSYEYAYHAMNRRYAYSKLEQRRFGKCLALGCATGDDVAPLAPQVGEFLCVEPAEQFWRDAIGGRPAHFMKPSDNGTLPVETGSFDLAVCLGVLNHLPNVSFVLSEFARILCPGGIFILREPICTMGDWRKPRTGVTSHQRGLPLAYLRQRLLSLGLAPISEKLCSFPLIPRIARLTRIRHAYNSTSLVFLDDLMSRLTRWNLHYHRDSLFKKVAPAQVFVVAAKNAALGGGT
jgi:SAM-dependent methyltransferase